MDVTPYKDASRLARLIDHTALKPETSEADVQKLCNEARQYGFASVCVNPCYVPLASEMLEGSSVIVCTVAGFPLGAMQPAAKAKEAELAIENGAKEVDMVLNVGKLRSRRFRYVEQDIRAVVDAVKGSSAKQAGVKIILETALLTDREKVIACVLSARAGADFVKTSTGFSTGGAAAADVLLMRQVVGKTMGVKAAGGIRTRKDALDMIAHGASRIGASASVSIVQKSEGKSGY